MECVILHELSSSLLEIFFFQIKEGPDCFLGYLKTKNNILCGPKTT